MRARLRNSGCSSNIARRTSAWLERHAPGDGVITGSGTINGRVVFVYAKDFTVFGGSLSETHAQKIAKLQDMALNNRAPLIGLFDLGGARIQEGVAALAGYGEVFQRNVLASGVIPQISLVMGPCAGGDVYSPALTDFIFMVKDTSYMFVTGPDVVRAVTNETVSAEDLAEPPCIRSKARWPTAPMKTMSRLCCKCGGWSISCRYRTRAAFRNGRVLMTPGDARSRSISLAPEDPAKPYDIKELIAKTVDEGDFFEIQEAFARNILTGFGRMEGRTVGLSPISQWCSPARSTRMPRARPHASCASAIVSIFRS